MPFLQVNDLEISFWVRRSHRAKRLQMIVQAGQFEIVLPLRLTQRMALQFVWAHRGWMAKQIRRSHTTARPLGWPSHFLPQETLAFRSQTLCLQVEYGSRAQVNLRQTTLHVPLGWEIAVTNLEAVMQQKIRDWLQQQAHALVQASLHHYCPQLGRWPQAVKLKQQKTRWGSCSPLGRITINWLLVLAPVGILEYVVLHELCHLFHRNHGKRFWAKVAHYMPDYQQYDGWLAKWGRYLHPN